MSSDQDEQQQQSTSERLLLPNSEGDSGSTTQVTVGGAGVSLVDELGPMVVNSDGTLSRIANWPIMTAAERARTLRVLGARNQLRLANEERKLHDKEKSDQGGPTSSEIAKSSASAVEPR